MLNSSIIWLVLPIMCHFFGALLILLYIFFLYYHTNVFCQCVTVIYSPCCIRGFICTCFDCGFKLLIAICVPSSSWLCCLATVTMFCMSMLTWPWHSLLCLQTYVLFSLFLFLILHKYLLKQIFSVTFSFNRLHLWFITKFFLGELSPSGAKHYK